MRSLKSHLGSDLITYIHSRRYSLAEVIGVILSEMKRRPRSTSEARWRDCSRQTGGFRRPSVTRPLRISSNKPPGRPVQDRVSARAHRRRAGLENSLAVGEERNVLVGGDLAAVLNSR